MFREVTLEMSLKPFKKTDTEYIQKTVDKIYEQWKPLLKGRKVINFMMWTSDGSEILDYAANPDDTFEWCRYLGLANMPLADKNDPKDRNLFEKTRLYTENPPVMTYGILKTIIEVLKTEGKKYFPEAEIRVGETFDIGPEFAPSDFKYHRHTEIIAEMGDENKARLEDKCVDSTAILNGDDRYYAAYPNGIPDKTPLALFLGKQTKCFCEDMGFDFLWLSNGVGFSSDPWELNGKIFDGEKFYPDRLGNTKKSVFEFWKNFRKGCPDLQVQTRGTNNTVGIDYATDGVPTYEIYKGGFNIVPPPNSPWAALNDNFGLEIMGQMTRVCELPADEYMFRYYLHDPWWINSPWYDRYDRNPHDIYLPMAISRVDETGRQRSADIFNILSIDNSYGEMPDFCVNETIPHFLRAEKICPDAMAPFVLVYPVREYSTAQSEEELHGMYFGDIYVCDSINDGFPLNCVVSSDIFLGHDAKLYKGSVLVSPVPETVEVKNKLLDFAAGGGRVIIYGDKKYESDFSDKKNIVYADINGDLLRKAAGRLGYCVSFGNAKKDRKNVTFTVHRNNNAFMFSLYNCNTTSSCTFNTPLGAPVLLTGECEVSENGAEYHFARSEERECRIFIKQKSGLISAKESPSGNDMMKRIFILEGLDDAEICYFPEKSNEDKAYVGPYVTHAETPTYFDSLERVDGGALGVYYKMKHVSGKISFYTVR